MEYLTAELDKRKQIVYFNVNCMPSPFVVCDRTDIQYNMATVRDPHGLHTIWVASGCQKKREATLTLFGRGGLLFINTLRRV